MPARQRRCARGGSVGRKALAGVVLLGTVALLAGCGAPRGVDGNLTDDWSMLPAVSVVVPTAPACHTVTESDLSTVTRWPPAVSCSTPHNVELFHVGTFAGADADRTTPPANG